MADGTVIEWTDATWNPIRARETSTGKRGWHCEHASEGCRNCYAETMNKWRGTGYDYKPGHIYVPFSERDGVEVFLDEKMLLAPLRWKNPRTIFVCSMTDLFADFVKDEWIDRMFAVMALCPQHRYQVLTKRAKRMRVYVTRLVKYCDGEDGLSREINDIIEDARLMRILKRDDPQVVDDVPFPNVWLGVSAEDQANADARIPDLLATPAAVRFVSLEPLLGPITLWDDYEGVLRGCGVIESGGVTVGTPHEPPEGYDDSYPGLDWVIVGGESGPHARPMHPDWTRSLRDQCQAAGVPFFFKQWGQWHADALLFTDLEGRSPPPAMRVGKKRAGRLLDGVEHNGMP